MEIAVQFKLFYLAKANEPSKEDAVRLQDQKRGCVMDPWIKLH